MRREFQCYYCNSSKVIFFLETESEYKLLKCLNCLLVYTFPQKSIKINAINSKKYNSREDEKSYLGIYDQIYKRAQRYAKKIQRYNKKGKYLDVGCSYGIYLKAANDIGFDTYGVEIAPNAANYAKKRFNLNVYKGTLHQAKYEPKIFDIVTLYDVLEHVPDLKKTLKELYRILKPGGLLVIQCPNVESYAFKILERDWNWLLVPNHLWHFSRTTLSKILKDNNFSIIEYTTWDSAYDFASNWVTKMGLTKPDATFLRRISRKIVYFIMYVVIFLGSIMWSRNGRGGSQIIYAKKI